MGLPAQATATLSQASIPPRRWRWGRCLRSILGASSIGVSSDTGALPRNSSNLTGALPSYPLLAGVVGSVWFHLHKIQVGIPSRSLLVELALSRSFDRWYICTDALLSACGRKRHEQWRSSALLHPNRCSPRLSYFRRGREVLFGPTSTKSRLASLRAHSR